VPERMNVRDLEGAPLACNEARLSLVAARLALLSETVVLHEPAHGGVARKNTELVLHAAECDEVVMHELVAPAGVLMAQGAERLLHPQRDAWVRASMARNLARQCFDWLLSVACDVKPALDGFCAETHRLTRRRMRPSARG
jgi:hypothetical protein